MPKFAFSFKIFSFSRFLEIFEGLAKKMKNFKIFGKFLRIFDVFKNF
jgi:hypothetical protein